MEIKLFEVRDRGTFLPVFALSTEPSNEEQRYLLRRCGFASPEAGYLPIIIARLHGEGNSSADAYHWGDRTMQTAHLYIDKHFHDLKDGDVIDVEYILGQSAQPKTSERNSL